MLLLNRNQWRDIFFLGSELRHGIAVCNNMELYLQ